MKPKLQGSCLRYCLLCSGACDDKPTDKGSKQGGDGGVGGVNCEALLKKQLKNMFVLLKLLEVPKNWCEGILRGDDEEEIGGGNPDSWFTLCDKCDDGKVEKAWEAYRQMIKWGIRLSEIKVQTKEEMRRGFEGNCFKERFYSDDGIEVVNFEVGKLLFPDLFEEMKEEIDEEDEAASFFTDDNSDDKPPSDSTMEAYLNLGSGTKGVSSSFRTQKSEPENEGARHSKINGIERRVRRPRKVNGPIKAKSLSRSKPPPPPPSRPTTPKRPKGRGGRPRKLNVGKSESKQSKLGQQNGNGQAYQITTGPLSLSVSVERINESLSEKQGPERPPRPRPPQEKKSQSSKSMQRRENGSPLKKGGRPCTKLLQSSNSMQRRENGSPPKKGGRPCTKLLQSSNSKSIRRRENKSPLLSKRGRRRPRQQLLQNSKSIHGSPLLSKRGGRRRPRQLMQSSNSKSTRRENRSPLKKGGGRWGRPRNKLLQSSLKSPPVLEKREGGDGPPSPSTSVPDERPPGQSSKKSLGSLLKRRELGRLRQKKLQNLKTLRLLTSAERLRGRQRKKKVPMRLST